MLRKHHKEIKTKSPVVSFPTPEQKHSACKAALEVGAGRSHSKSQDSQSTSCFANTRLHMTAVKTLTDTLRFFCTS